VSLCVVQVIIISLYVVQDTDEENY